LLVNRLESLPACTWDGERRIRLVVITSHASLHELDILASHSVPLAALPLPVLEVVLVIVFISLTLADANDCL